MKPETKMILIMLARRRKQEILGKPVDPFPDLKPEQHLQIIDIVLDDLMKDDLLGNPEANVSLTQTVADLRGEIEKLKELLRDWETWEAGLIIDGTEICIEAMKPSNLDAMVVLQQRRLKALESEDKK